MRKVKRKKISFKKTIKILIPLFILIIILINYKNILTFYQSKKTGYEFKTINT